MQSSVDRMKSASLLVMFVAFLWLGTKVAANEQIDFVHNVVPILKKHCVECHGGKESKGGFSVNTRDLILDAEVVTIGKADKSQLVALISSQDKKEQMPPKDRPRLSTKELAIIRDWIDQGLKWEESFTFAPKQYEPPLRPRAVQLPPIVDDRFNPVDRILDAYFVERKLPYPEQIGDAAFLRRLSLDVNGLLPTPVQLDEFLSDDRRDKRMQAIRRVLQDQRAYADHWLTFWNDLLRNAYSGTGYIDGGRKQITGWLYQSLRENKPYDQFVRELIAPTSESEGFIFGIKWRGNVNASQTREIQFAQSVAQVFLGINMKCASCHDSFIDRWTLEEAYGLAAVYSTRPLELHRCDKPTGTIAEAAWIFPDLGEIDPNSPQPERLKQLAGLMTHRDNGRFTRTIVNRIWHRLMGRGIVHPVDAMHTEPWNADLLDYLANHLVENRYDLKKTMELIVTSHAYQSSAVVVENEPSVDDYVYSGPPTKRMTAEQFFDAIWSIGNTWPKPNAQAFRIDGRSQGGQLVAVLQSEIAHADTADKNTNWQAIWGNRPVRAALAPLDQLQASLGRPNREQVVTTRPSLLTTLEAINLANDQTLADTLWRGSQNLRAQFSDRRDLIQWLYKYALSREPAPDEFEIAEELLGTDPTEQSVSDLLWVVFMLPEFQLIR